MRFKLFEGINAGGCEKLCSSYKLYNNQIEICCSADDYQKFFSGILNILSEPVFFFTEIPCSDDKELSLRSCEDSPYHYELYYLDNCTRKVAKAIVKRYGSILFNDGLIRFGFGSHSTDDEVFSKRFQEISIYSKDGINDYKSLLDSCGFTETSDLKTLSDLISDENPAECCTVESDGETVFDMIENLKEAGLYFADTVEE